VIHGDIKPSNVLWNPTSKQLTLIDFEVSIMASKKPKVMGGTRPFAVETYSFGLLC